MCCPAWTTRTRPVSDHLSGRSQQATCLQVFLLLSHITMHLYSCPQLLLAALHPPSTCCLATITNLSCLCPMSSAETCLPAYLRAASVKCPFHSLLVGLPSVPVRRQELASFRRFALLISTHPTGVPAGVSLLPGPGSDAGRAVDQLLVPQCHLGVHLWSIHYHCHHTGTKHSSEQDHKQCTRVACMCQLCGCAVHVAGRATALPPHMFSCWDLLASYRQERRQICAGAAHLGLYLQLSPFWLLVTYFA